MRKNLPVGARILYRLSWKATFGKFNVWLIVNLAGFVCLLNNLKNSLHVVRTALANGTAMGPVRIRHSSHDFGWQSSHSVDLAGWQAKMASIEMWIQWRNAHKPHLQLPVKVCSSRGAMHKEKRRSNRITVTGEAFVENASPKTFTQIEQFDSACTWT